VDEAHATGLNGPNGRGVGEALGVNDRIEIQMGTLGKALGASGGYICGSRVLVDYLVNRARTLIFSTAPVPAATAAARAGIEFVQSIAGKERRELLWTRVAQLKAALNNSESAGSEFASAIVPIMIGKEEEAMRASSRLRDAGIFVPGIRYPTVAKGQARLRVTLTAAHSEDDVRRLHAGIASLKSTRTVTTEARA